MLMQRHRKPESDREGSYGLAVPRVLAKSGSYPAAHHSLRL